jgi:hypothetical protein
MLMANVGKEVDTVVAAEAGELLVVFHPNFITFLCGLTLHDNQSSVPQ